MAQGTDDNHAALSQESHETALLRLLLELDSTPNDTAAMELALDAITASIPCRMAFFYEWSEQAGQVRVRVRAASDPESLSEYLARFRVRDPCTSDIAQQRCIISAACLSLDDVLGPDQTGADAFRTGFLEPNGGLRNALVHHASLIGHQRISLHLFRDTEQPPFSVAERAQLDTFYLHIIRRLRQHRAHDQTRYERDLLQCSFDLLQRPTFLLDSQARVLACNNSAHALTRAGKRLQLENDHLLPGSAVDHASWLPDALRRLLMPSRTGAAPESYLHAFSNPRRQPIRTFALLTRIPAGRPCGAALACLSLLDLNDAPPCHAHEELRRVFNFTRAEARVADALIAGMGTEEIAMSFEIHRDTVRSHIKHLLAKTGTRGHAELQKLLLRIAPPYTPLLRRRQAHTARNPQPLG